MAPMAKITEAKAAAIRKAANLATGRMAAKLIKTITSTAQTTPIKREPIKSSIEWFSYCIRWFSGALDAGFARPRLARRWEKGARHKSGIAAVMWGRLAAQCHLVFPGLLNLHS
jgi:hypothetical protein